MIRILEKLRKVAFWSLDWFKGGHVWKHYREIRYIQQNPLSRRATGIKQEHLSKILDHAVKTVPFYAKFASKKMDLTKFPIINKQLIRENFETFRSHPYKNKYNHQVLTSGSTGKPFRILQDKSKRERNTADTLFFAKRAGYDIGARLYYLRLWDKQYQKGKIQSFVQNLATYSVDDLNDANLAKLVQELENDKSSINILGYTSALESICNYLDKHHGKPLKGNFCSIIAVAEALSNDVRQKILKYFGVDAISRYSNSENGILAQRLPKCGSSSFEINWASYFVELLDLNEDKPVKLGAPGRIVVTDLFNYSMPMLRYDTGDVGVMEQDPENNELIFTKIEGRKMDMFTNTKGEYISSHIIHHILQFRGIEQFQFIQEDYDQYVIKLKVSKKLDYEDELALCGQYQEYFGADANISVVYVEDIPLLPSGKRKLVLNNAILKQRKLAEKKSEEVTGSMAETGT
ncbi:CoF synthetase [Muricauda sp. JGD-17]|uniref:CoF synthetase n=1 Tax=Flagellimonas ochracea TaxID=2696472 RepID=A0A964WWN1_9FLAO|nr:phenylacetate--CoA ligase family protein [Allomuricauda ochracea]NAY91241.1 CoF synthetase [Allomuricauda ochracea]